MRVNLIYNNNKAGTPRTALMIAGVLEAGGATLSHSPLDLPRAPEYLAAWLQGLVGQPRYDVNIFLEQVRPRWFPLARHNLLVPNQEWFDHSWLPELPKFDKVLAKTREAERLFAALGATVEHMGFTAVDQRLEPTPPPVDGVLHLAGRSLQKGTEAVLRVWERHPEWPTLTVIQRPPNPEYSLWHPPLPNVVYHSRLMSDAKVRHMQNTHRLHVCPSLAEGFGHTLVEGMSCGAVMITTDAPPMNELVGPDRGILVGARPAEAQGVGQLYRVDETALEEAVASALTMSPSAREEMGARARAWYEENDQAFRKRLSVLIAGLNAAA